jgi:hypothetical protein
MNTCVCGYKGRAGKVLGLVLVAAGYRSFHLMFGGRGDASDAFQTREPSDQEGLPPAGINNTTWYPPELTRYTRWPSDSWKQSSRIDETTASFDTVSKYSLGTR